jgi:hypothetical protein
MSRSAFVLVTGIALIGCPTANPIIPEKDGGDQTDDTGFVVFDSGVDTDTGVVDTGDTPETGKSVRGLFIESVC